MTFCGEPFIAWPNPKSIVGHLQWCSASTPCPDCQEKLRKEKRSAESVRMIKHWAKVRREGRNKPTKE